MSRNYERKTDTSIYPSRHGLKAIVHGSATVVPHAVERGWMLPGGRLTEFAWIAMDAAVEMDALIRSGQNQKAKTTELV